MTTGGVRRNAIIFAFAASMATLCAQVNSGYAFARHLSSQRLHSQALHFLHFEKRKIAADTLNFLLGLNHHQLRHKDSAAFYLGNVMPSSVLFPPARAYAVLNLLYARNITAAEKMMGPMKDLTGEQAQVALLMKGGMQLLRRDYAEFDSTSARFDFLNYTYREQQAYLKKIKERIVTTKTKSPVTAGFLSALVPGLGKYYAGRKGAAVAALLTNGFLAVIAAESAYRSGFRSPQFITFSGLLAIFYTGNIVGSVHSVKQQQRTNNGRFDNEILGTVHQSVDRVYNP
jgi:hypothetical protein